MADNYYNVLIQLGDPSSDNQSWTVTHTGDPHAADELTPIAGMKFGWSMPDNILWPLQPEPMTAVFAFNAPEFADLSWVGEDVPVAIEVKLHASADPAFAFYGRITDASATPRRGRPGVTVSCTAVDYTVDVTRGEYAGSSLATSFEDEALEQVWADNAALFGDFPAWPLPVGGVGHGLEVQIADAPGKKYDTIIGPILAQAIETGVTVPTGIAKGGGTDTALVILAPNIDPATRLPDADQPFAFDLLFKHPHQAHTIDAALMDRQSIAWGRNKRTRVDSIRVLTVGGIGVDQSLEFGSFPLRTMTELQTVSNDLTRVGNIGVFYLAADAPLRRGWNVTAVRYLLDQVPAAEFGTDFPMDLMPRWTEASTEPSRASCYGTVLTIDGVIEHTNPYGDDPDPEILGLLSSVDFSLSGGRPALTLGFRQLQEAADPVNPGAFGSGGYAVTPYGALAPA